MHLSSQVLAPHFKFFVYYFTKFNSSNGFSFHSCRDNAYKLFKVHYMHYKRDNSLPKPFLLVGDDYTISDIDLDYKISLSVKTVKNKKIKKLKKSDQTATHKKRLGK